MLMPCSNSIQIRFDIHHINSTENYPYSNYSYKASETLIKF